MTTKDRLITFLAYINISQGRFEKGVGLSTGFVNNVGDSIRKSSLDKISSVYPELNTAWLLTGVGNMINENKNNVGRDNYGVQGGGSQNISGNMVNVTMPESGTQKIIKPWTRFHKIKKWPLVRHAHYQEGDKRKPKA